MRLLISISNVAWIEKSKKSILYEGLNRKSNLLNFQDRPTGGIAVSTYEAITFDMELKRGLSVVTYDFVVIPKSGHHGSMSS